MPRRASVLTAILISLCCVVVAGETPVDQASTQAATLVTSLHATRAGKGHWYSAANGGFERLTGVGIEQLGCTECHGKSNADGDPYPAEYPGAGCIDCHASADQSVAEAQCLSCHGRQGMEAGRLGLPDVHRDAGMVCWDCHGSQDLHGDGTSYRSMLEPGAIKAACEDCHTPSKLGPQHAEYDPHDGALHCSACHTRSVISCYSCHFESQVEAHVKRAHRPLDGFVMMVNRDQDGKVHAATFQSLTYQGKGFVAFAPYSAHTIGQGRSCTECHVGKPVNGSNAAISQYNSQGEIRFAEWDAEAGSLSWLKGIVPIPVDYKQTLRMDLVTFDGDPASPLGQGSWSALGSERWDGSQMLFATPLTREQMDKLGFARKARRPGR
jgi:hypothetical protein